VRADAEHRRDQNPACVTEFTVRQIITRIPHTIVSLSTAGTRFANEIVPGCEQSRHALSNHLKTLALAYISLGREPGREQRLRLKIFGQAAGQR